MEDQLQMNNYQRSFLERVITTLRDIRKQKHQSVEKFENPITCHYQDVKARLNEREKGDFLSFDNPQYFCRFADLLKNNPKVGCDAEKKVFFFKNKFTTPDALIEKLFQERIGVKVCEDLYDDLTERDLEKLISINYIRVIRIELNKNKENRDKKSKYLEVLFSHYHTDDEISKERENYEKISPKSLKDYWNKIDQSEIDRKVEKTSTLSYLNNVLNHPKHLKKTEKRKKRQFRDDDNIYEWKNEHIVQKIDKAMTMLAKRQPESRKKLERRLHHDQMRSLRNGGK